MHGDVDPPRSCPHRDFQNTTNSILDILITYLLLLILQVSGSKPFRYLPRESRPEAAKMTTSLPHRNTGGSVSDDEAVPDTDPSDVSQSELVE